MANSRKESSFTKLIKIIQEMVFKAKLVADNTNLIRDNNPCYHAPFCTVIVNCSRFNASHS